MLTVHFVSQGEPVDRPDSQAKGVQTVYKEWNLSMKIATRRHLGFLLSIKLIFFLLFHSTAFAQVCEAPVATVTSVQGTVESQLAGTSQWRMAQLNDSHCPGDTIRVGEDSRADLTLANRSVLRLNANSEVTLGAIQNKRNFLIKLLNGAAHLFSRGPRALEVQTPSTVVGVRGTEFYLQVQATQTLVSVFEGEVLAANEAGELALKSGQPAVAELGKAPVLRTVARPRDAVQWV